jgi:mRNA interferase MazF
MNQGRTIQPGDILVVALPTRAPAGHEQIGTRPVVVAAVPPEPLRYPVVIVVPLTTRAECWQDANPSVYIGLRAGAGGLPHQSAALLDQVGGIDVRRIEGHVGTLSKEDSQRVLGALRRMLGGSSR